MALPQDEAVLVYHRDLGVRVQRLEFWRVGRRIAAAIIATVNFKPTS